MVDEVDHPELHSEEGEKQDRLRANTLVADEVSPEGMAVDALNRFTTLTNASPSGTVSLCSGSFVRSHCHD